MLVVPPLPVNTGPRRRRIPIRVGAGHRRGGTMPGFQNHPKNWVVGDAAPRAVYSLGRYFTDFTGAWFERLAGTQEPHRITASDIIAVSMMSATVPARSTIWILNDGAAEIEALLQQIPDDLDIWDADDGLEGDGALAALWTRLQSRTAQWEGGQDASGIGPVIAGKLLATKRPRLMPLFDTVVADALGSYEHANYWRSWKEAFADAELLPAVHAVQAEAAKEHPEIAELSPLRILDVVIWHQNR
jgi:hypothetical protein